METATQEIIYQLIGIVGTVLMALLSVAAKKLIDKFNLEKYGLEIKDLEEVVGNAVDYAENYGKQQAKKYSKKIASKDKLDLAREYINKVDTKTVKKYGDKLDTIIERKVSQKFSK